jgi:predicted dinucleotide-binding enzyme
MINYNIARIYSGNVIINDYVVMAVKCRDIPMVVRRLYSGNVIVIDYLVPAVISLHFTSGTT